MSPPLRTSRAGRRWKVRSSRRGTRWEEQQRGLLNALAKARVRQCGLLSLLSTLNPVETNARKKNVWKKGNTKPRRCRRVKWASKEELKDQEEAGYSCWPWRIDRITCEDEEKRETGWRDKSPRTTNDCHTGRYGNLRRIKRRIYSNCWYEKWAWSGAGWKGHWAVASCEAEKVIASSRKHEAVHVPVHSHLITFCP